MPMGKLTNADRLKKDGTCTFCGTTQPLRNVKCEKCAKRLPLPRPRFSDEVGPASAFAWAATLTLVILVLPSVAFVLFSPAGSLLWIFAPGYLLIGLSVMIFGAPDESDLSTALDTPDYTGAGKHFNSHADSVLTSMFIAIPFMAVRRAWVRFLVALSDD